MVDSGLDELQVEQQAAYRKRLGRWSRECIETVQDPLFGFLLSIARQVHGPHIHFTRICNTTQTQVQMETKGGGILAQLATARCADIAAEYVQLWREGTWESILKQSPPGLLEQLSSLCAGLILHQAADFHRRIREPLERYSPRN